MAWMSILVNSYLRTRFSMRSAQSSILLLVLFALVLSACAPQSITPIVSRPAKVERFPGDGMRDKYVQFVERGREYMRSGRFDLAEGYFEVASHEQFFEMPNYNVWIELAESQCRNGNTAEGLKVLVDYDMALEVDIGNESCIDEWHPKYQTPPNSRMSMRVFGELCGAIISHLTSFNLSVEERQNNQAIYMELKAESAVLARSCEGISSVR